MSDALESVTATSNGHTGTTRSGQVNTKFDAWIGDAEVTVTVWSAIDVSSGDAVHGILQPGKEYKGKAQYTLRPPEDGSQPPPHSVKPAQAVSTAKVTAPGRATAQRPATGDYERSRAFLEHALPDTVAIARAACPEADHNEHLRAGQAMAVSLYIQASRAGWKLDEATPASADQTNGSGQFSGDEMALLKAKVMEVFGPGSVSASNPDDIPF